LVLTRVLLHKPRLVVIDEALDPLDDDARNRVLRLLNDELKDAAIIDIGRCETESHFFTRVLHLVKDPQGISKESCRNFFRMVSAPANNARTTSLILQGGMRIWGAVPWDPARRTCQDDCVSVAEDAKTQRRRRSVAVVS